MTDLTIEKIENMLGAHNDGVYRLEARDNLGEIFRFLLTQIKQLRHELDREVRSNLVAEAQLRAWRDAVYIEGLPMRPLPETDLGDPVPPIPVVTPERLTDLLDELHALRQSCNNEPTDA